MITFRDSCLIEIVKLSNLINDSPFYFRSVTSYRKRTLSARVESDPYKSCQYQISKVTSCDKH